MIEAIGRILQRIIPKSIIDQRKRSQDMQDYALWEASGRPVPPPHLLKQQVILEYRDRFKSHVLVETGTFLGDMVHAHRKNFRRIISIELGEELYQNAKRRFRQFDHISILQGDSGKVLPSVISSLDQPAIFWLDGHYSAGPTARGEKDCPIYEELDAIFSGPSVDHILLIDDARLFNGTNDYPTIDDLSAYMKHNKPFYRCELKDDIIRFTPE